MINKIGKVTLYVNSQEEAILFWSKVGFDVVFNQEMAPGFSWVEVAPKDAQTTLVLYSKAMMESQNTEMVSLPSLLFSTKDIKVSYEEFKANGVVVEELQIMDYGSMFAFFDQDGNKYILREDK